VRDLNDLYLFAEIVRCGGFSAASRALRIPKSRLSRRIAALEDYLNVRLVQRSERAFSVTPAGTLFYRHCLSVIEQAQTAENALAEMRGKPRGVVRVSCPMTMAQYVLAPILPRFLAENEEVEVDVSFTNRSVNVMEAPFDVALFIHRAPLQSKSVVARAIGRSAQVLVTGRALFEKWPRPKTPQDLRVLPSLSGGRGTGADEWELIGPDQVKTAVPVTPRLVSESLVILKRAAIAGVGVARLPALICQEELAAGILERVLPSWSMPSHEIHLVYPTRKGMTPAIRAFVEYVMRAAVEQLGRV
jgi:DNA-binding transcriptional LysR family regulator